MAYNTRNPIGSTDPRDLYDNAQNLDNFVNNRDLDAYNDRFGVPRKTWTGMENEFAVYQDLRADQFVLAQEDRANRFDDFLVSSGYAYIGDYTSGITITEYNQIVRDSEGEFWRISGETALPYITTGAGLPEGGSFVPVGDAALRQQLGNAARTDGLGSELVAFYQKTEDSVIRSVHDKLSEVISVSDFMLEQDRADIASGASSLGVRQAVKKAVAYVNEVGGTLYFPPGHYNSPYLDHTDIENWIEITKSGVSLVASPGSVVLENFLFYVHGTYGTPQLVGSAGFTTGDTQINTATAHNLSAGDYVQLLSGINPYTPDAGDWQLGSQNPTTLSTPDCRFAEIHRVFYVGSATTATIYDNVIYSNYRDNTVGQSFPLAGVVGAEIRKLSPVVGIKLEGLTFKNTSTSLFRGILVRCAVDVRFAACHFHAGELPGAHVRTSDVLNILFDSCTSFRNPIDSSGSGWNSFIIGGCTQNSIFSKCTFVGEQQTIDVSPNLSSSDVGYTGDVVRSSYLTTQIINFSDCVFTECSDGFTTHPATYNLRVSGCLFEGCSTGLRSRNRKSTIVGNTFKTFATGVALSAFYEDCLISANSFEKLPMPVARSWLGVSFTPLSSEIMNNNEFHNVVVSNNVFKVTQPHIGNAGVHFRHNDNGLPPNPEFTLFTGAVKTKLSTYQITGNSFTGCSVYVLRWINGVNIIGNVFRGGSDQTHYILCAENSARHTISGNIYLDTSVQGLSVGDVTDTDFQYVTKHRIGYQFGTSGPVTGSVPNSQGIFQTGFGLPSADGVKLLNGSRVEATRAAGVSTLRLDAVAEDGTSNVDIRVFDQNTTTGSKTLAVTGRVSSENSYPRTDNSYSSGLPANRWSVVYSATGAINTSDLRDKQQIREILEAERAVALRLKGIIKAFKFTDAVEKKGEGARIHFGWIAQEVKNAFDCEGLDAESYALFCYDEWEADTDEEGAIVLAAGNRYGIRYDELIAFILAAS